MRHNSSFRVRPWLILAVIGTACIANHKEFVEWRQELTRRQDISDLRGLSLVAHAGGLPDKLTRPNTVTAMEKSYEKGHRFFEIDLSWTLDNILVGIHDWADSWVALGGEHGSRPALTRPGSMPKTGADLMTLEEACQWRKKRPKARLITDPKSRHIEALLAIKHTCGTKNIIPQVHNEAEYHLARELGFHSIILTLYRTNKHPDYSWEGFTDRGLIGITIPKALLSHYDLSRFPKRICVMTHTVNEAQEIAHYFERGACGIYTDILMPDNIRQTPN